MKLRVLSVGLILLHTACSFSPRLPEIPAPIRALPAATPSPQATLSLPAPTRTPTLQPTIGEPTALPTAANPPLPPRIDAQNAAGLRPAAIYPLFRRGLLRSVIWSPDGQNLVADTSLGTQILSAADLKKRFSLPYVHPHYFLADGSLLTLNGSELTRQDLNGGLARVLPIQPAQDEQAGSIFALSPDSRTWVTRASDNSLNVLDLQSGEAFTVTLQSKTRIALQIEHLFFTGSGELLFAHARRVDGETEIIALDAATWEQVYELFNTDSIPVFSPDGTRMAFQSGERIVVNLVEDGSNWSGFARSMVQDLPGHDGLLTAQGFSFIGAADRLGVLYNSAIRDEEAHEMHFLPATLTIYNTSNAAVERVISDLPAHTDQFAFSPDGSLFFTTGPDGILRLWDSVSGRLLKASEPFDTDMHPAVRLDGKQAAHTQDGQVIIEDTASGVVEQTLGEYPAAVRMTSAFNGENILAVSVETPWNRFIDTYDLDNGNFLQRYPDLYGCSFSRSTTLMICPGEVIRFFAMPSGSALLSLVPQSQPLEYAVSQDGRRVASCTLGSEFIFVWEVQLGTIPKYNLGGKRGVCGKLAFSADGRTLASSSGMVWDVESGRELLTFEPVGDGLMAINAGGTLLVIYPALISLESGDKIGELQAAPDLQALSFQPDGRTLLMQTRRGVELWMIEQ